MPGHAGVKHINMHRNDRNSWLPNWRGSIKRLCSACSAQPDKGESSSFFCIKLQECHLQDGQIWAVAESDILQLDAIALLAVHQLDSILFVLDLRPHNLA